MHKGELNNLFDFTKKLAREAGALVVDYRERGRSKANIKESVHLVTDADIAADTLITKRIHELFPQHTIVSEELAPDTAALDPVLLTGPVWIIDPIDGTTNYAYGNNINSVSIAYAEGGIVQFGVIYAPFTDTEYAAVRGGGATKNGVRFTTPDTRSLDEALIATGFVYRRDNPEFLLNRLRAIFKHCRDIRRFGACTLDICGVAEGTLDGFYETVKVWDIAAALVIAEEAGARTGHINKLPPEWKLPSLFYTEGILVAPPKIFEGLQKILCEADAG